ncbi:FAD-binding oxidoreductase [Ruegeria sp. AU67]|uniref:NAD(P)/FAD-dependent oxidoreductase n=1 Tax=Ruegeria sp. AU67 TaxID=2108530 RepID=UPI000D691DD2|nr:FAD-dependent oxidoreductase [Ruegeria sp. AU67]
MIRNENPVIANSLWSSTASYSAEYPQLVGEQQSDVAVIGAGFTGLSAALNLVEQGDKVVVIDAQHPGWGASGRNGGQINVGLKDGPTGIKTKFGDLWGNRMIRMAGEAADLVFDLIARHGIECDAKRPGWLRAAHTHKTLSELHKLAEDWNNHGGGMIQLDQSEMQRLTGTEAYLGGVLDRRGGALHPLKYALGLAEAGRRNGVEIFGDTPANQITSEADRFRIETPKGTVISEKVLICTNAYSGDLHPRLSTPA